MSFSNLHSMTTRSKNTTDPPNDTDEHGNITDLIDYDCNDGFNKDELYGEIYKLSKGRISMLDIQNNNINKKKKKKKKIIIEEISETPSPKKTIKHPKTHLKKTGSGNALSGLLMNYILAKANEQIKKKPHEKRKPKKKKVIHIEFKDTDID